MRAAVIPGITAVVLGVLCIVVAFVARDFKSDKRSTSERKRMPGWVGRTWFLVAGVLALVAGIWALSRR